MYSRKSCAAVAVALAFFFAGCGSDEQAPDAPESPVEATIVAEGNQDRMIALDFQRYLERNCPESVSVANVPDRFKDTPAFERYERDLPTAVALCSGIATIEVEDSRVLVRSDLGEDADREAAGRIFCSIVRASDVADFTPAHELRDEAGDTVKVCTAQEL